LADKSFKINNITFISGQVECDSADILKNIIYQFRTSSENTVMVIGTNNGGKAGLVVAVSDNLVNQKKINAVSIIKEISGEINGGGGGQPFLATAGGKKPEGIPNALEKAAEYLKKY